MRPIVEIMFADFLPTAGDAIVNQLPKYRYMSGGQFAVPVTVRVIGGGDRPVRDAAQRDRRELVHAPARPAGRDRRRRPASAYELLRAAIADDNPVARSSSTRACTAQGPGRPRRDRRDRQGRRSCAPGSDVTIVATLLMVERALAAAEQLAAEGIEAEVIDLRWLRPLDLPTVRASVEQDRSARHRRGAVARGRLGRDDHQRADHRRRARGQRRRAAVSLPDDLLDPLQPAARGRGPPVGRARSPPRPGPASAVDRTRPRDPVAGRGRASTGRRCVIERIETLALRAPLGRRFSGSAYSMDNRTTIVTRLYTADGLVSRGLQRRHGRRAGAHRRDHPRRAGAAAPRPQRRPTPRAPGGPWSPSTNDILRDRGLALQAIACLDTAIWDVFGRALGLPLHRLWGCVDRLAPDERHRRLLPPRRATRSREVIARLREAGFAGMKFKVGGRTPGRGRRARARRARGGRPGLRRSWSTPTRATTAPQAVEFGRLVADLDIRWFEEPCRWTNDRALDARRALPDRASRSAPARAR